MSKSNRELIDNIHCWQIEIFSFLFFKDLSRSVSKITQKYHEPWQRKGALLFWHTSGSRSLKFQNRALMSVWALALAEDELSKCPSFVCFLVQINLFFFFFKDVCIANRCLFLQIYCLLDCLFFLCRVCLFSLSLHEFSPGNLASSHTPKTYMLG